MSNSSTLFCDTSFFFACLSPKDANHAVAKTTLETYSKYELATTWAILSETITLLRYRGDYALAIEFIEQVIPKLKLIHYENSIHDEAIKVFKKFSKDKKLSFCDCISFVILTALIPNTPILTFDRDFKQFGFGLSVPIL